MAAALDIDENRYTRYERGTTEPSFELIVKMCRLLATTPNNLFEFQELRQPSPSSIAGFSAQPQPPFLDRPQPTGPGEAQAQQPPPSTMQIAAAAWRLSAEVQRLQERLSGSVADQGSNELAAIRQTAKLFEELKGDPFGTIARLSNDPVLATGNRKALVALRRQIGQFVKIVERETLNRE